jgi:hypothetical protein
MLQQASAKRDRAASKTRAERSAEMSSDDKAQKISIGFHSGQSLVARVKPGKLQKFREALGSNSGWYELDGEDGVITLDLARIDYLLVDSDEHRVGF